MKVSKLKTITIISLLMAITLTGCGSNNEKEVKNISKTSITELNESLKETTGYDFYSKEKLSASSSKLEKDSEQLTVFLQIDKAGRVYEDGTGYLMVMSDSNDKEFITSPSTTTDTIWMYKDGEKTKMVSGYVQGTIDSIHKIGLDKEQSVQPEEISEIDEETLSQLKLSVLNPANIEIPKDANVYDVDKNIVVEFNVDIQSDNAYASIAKTGLASGAPVTFNNSAFTGNIKVTLTFNKELKLIKSSADLADVLTGFNKALSKQAKEIGFNTAFKEIVLEQEYSYKVVKETFEIPDYLKEAVQLVENDKK